MSTTYYKDSKEYTYREALALTGANFKEVDKNIAVFIREGFEVVMTTPKPTPTTELKQVLRDGVTIDALGNTVMAWKEVDMFTSDLVEDGVVIKTIAEQEAEYLAKLAEDAIKAKILEGETYIEGLLQVEIVKFNTKYFTKFTEINDMASYAIDTAYSLQVQCDTLIKWKNNLWDTARTNQASVLAGTMTDAEFLAALPVAPVV
jgi:hypothetical protein